MRNAVRKHARARHGHAESTSAFARGRALLRSRDFRLLWSGQAFAQIGDGLVKVALLWYVYNLTGSALKMTMIGLLQTLPPLVLGPLIGVYLDRLPKKPFMITVDAVRGALTLVIPLLHAFGMLTLGRLYALVLLTAVFAAVFGPAMSAAVPMIVKRDQLTGANAWIQSTVTIGMVVGPALSGSGIALIGVENVLWIGGPMFLISALLLLPIHLNEDCAERRGGALASLGTDLVCGLKFIFLERAAVRLMMLTSVLHSIAASAFVFLLPVYASKVAHVGPAELGWYWSMYGVGMMAVSVGLGFMKQGRPGTRYLIMAAALALGSFGSFTLGGLTNFYTGLISILLIGGSLAVVTPIIWARLQEETPADMRGRVFTTFGSGAMFASMIGILGFGWAADRLGAQWSLVAMGAILGATALLAVGLRIWAGSAARRPAADAQRRRA